jgi:CrcB protein
LPARPPIRLLVARLPIDPDVGAAEDAPLGPAAQLALVAVGGVAGTLLRAGLASGSSPWAGAQPWSTLAINVVGSLLLAMLLATIHERYPRARVARPLLGTGFCGGFTTFSTFAVDFAAYAHDGRPQLAAGYLLGSVFGSLVAAVIGVVLVRAVLRLSQRPEVLRRAEHAGLFDPEDRP